jgi:hypothetical protein
MAGSMTRGFDRACWVRSLGDNQRKRRRSRLVVSWIGGICSAGYPVELTFERYSVDLTAGSAEAYIDMMADYYGPLLQARNKLSGDGRWSALRSELVALSVELNTSGDGSFRAPSAYLVALAHKHQ